MLRLGSYLHFAVLGQFYGVHSCSFFQHEVRERARQQEKERVSEWEGERESEREQNRARDRERARERERKRELMLYLIWFQYMRRCDGAGMEQQGSCRAEGGYRLVGLRLGLEQVFEHRSRDRTRVNGVCDFKKVRPDQICPSTKRD